MTSVEKRHAIRETNIDLLRVVAMLGIILFHHFGTKIPNHFVQLPIGFTTDTYFYDLSNNAVGYVAKASLLMDFCYGHFGNGGNLIFMLVTGYFLFGRASSLRKRARTVANVLLAIIFYGVLLTLLNFMVLVYVRPHIATFPYNPIFTLPNWLSGENMWYLQAYGIFILVIVPILKLFEDRLTKDVHRMVCVALACFNFLAYGKYLPNLFLSAQIIQFITCYYIGGYVRTYGVGMSLGKLLALLCLYVVSYLCYEYYWRYSNMVLHKPSEYSYISVMQPFICCFIFSLLCFAICTKVRISGKGFANAIALLTSVKFSHCQSGKFDQSQSD